MRLHDIEVALEWYAKVYTVIRVCQVSAARGAVMRACGLSSHWNHLQIMGKLTDRVLDQESSVPMRVLEAAATVLRGLAQVFFLRSAAAGLVLLCGLAQAAPHMAGAAVLGSAIGAGLSTVLGQDRDKVRQGLYGYNTALVAMAMQVFHQPSDLAWFLAAGVAVVAALALQVCWRLPVPPYTAPFVLVTWTVLAAAPMLGLHPRQMALAAGQELQALEGVLHGLAQVMFAKDLLAGLCVLVAIALESPRLALQALAASGLGLGIGWLAGMPNPALGAGLAGFNAVLCVLVLARRGGVVWALVTATGATLLSLAAQRAGLPALTGPFILCSWAALPYARRDGAQGSTRRG